MTKVRRWGSRIRWFTAASDSGTVETNSASDGPQRRTVEERESFKSGQTAVGLIHRLWRVDVGNVEIAGAMAGRAS